MKGRQPIPKHLRLLTGTPAKRREAALEIAPGEPLMPDWLPDEGKAIWRRVADELLSRGVLCRCDEGCLTGFCVSYADVVEAERVLATEGYTTPTNSGGRKSHPALAARNAALAHLRAFGSELGLSPVARNRLQAPGAPQDDDFAAWQES